MIGSHYFDWTYQVPSSSFGSSFSWVAYITTPVSQPIIAKSLDFYSASGIAFTGRGFIYNDVGALVASTAQYNSLVVSQFSNVELALTSSPLLTQNKGYFIGFYTVNNSIGYYSGNAPTGSVNSTPAGYTAGRNPLVYYSAGDGWNINSGTSVTGALAIRMSFNLPSTDDTKVKTGGTFAGGSTKVLQSGIFVNGIRKIRQGGTFV